MAKAKAHAVEASSITQLPAKANMCCQQHGARKAHGSREQPAACATHCPGLPLAPNKHSRQLLILQAGSLRVTELLNRAGALRLTWHHATNTMTDGGRCPAAELNTPTSTTTRSPVVLSFIRLPGHRLLICLKTGVLATSIDQMHASRPISCVQHMHSQGAGWQTVCSTAQQRTQTAK